MNAEFLKSTHPIWAAHHEEWARRERLFRGGVDVIETELPAFSWEDEGGASHLKRQREAVYPGFGEAYVRTLVGHVLKDRPDSDGGLQMGRMGTIERGEGQAQASEAEMVYYNINGTGGDGQQLWQWVASVFQRAGATGIRWSMVETPPWAGGQPTGQDVLNGQRPYAVEFSPRSVTNWKIERGTLQWCVIRTRQDTRRVVDGALSGEANEAGYYLLVGRGVTELGTAYQSGGWWKFDKEGNAVPDTPTSKASGNWDRTGGEIPMAFAVWEWETESVGEDTPLPMARSGTTALDNLSVGYMNLKSAWRSNGWRSAGAPDFLLGVDAEAWPIARTQYEGGAGLIGVPRGQEGANPTLAHGSAALVSAQAFKALLDDMTAEAERMAVQQATSTADSSGRSKEAGFTESKAPRLVMLAENIESFLNTLLRFFEMRFGHSNPGAYVQMPRQFDLKPVEDDIRDFFDTFRRSQLRSATLESEAMIRLAEGKGLVSDENRETVLAELAESARASATAGTQEAGLFGSLFGGNGGGTEAEEEVE